jgi:hypothetical protein
MNTTLELALVLLVSSSISAWADDWRYSEQTDKMNGSQTKLGEVFSDNSLDLAFPYSGENRGRLVVRQDKQNGLNVIFTIRKGQLICDSYHGCQVQVRFDEAQPVTFHGGGAADHSSTTIFLTPERRFIDLAKKAKRIRVAVTVYQAGSQVLEFSSSTSLIWDTPKAASGGAAGAVVAERSQSKMALCNDQTKGLPPNERARAQSDCMKTMLSK